MPPELHRYISSRDDRKTQRPHCWQRRSTKLRALVLERRDSSKIQRETETRRWNRDRCTFNSSGNFSLHIPFYEYQRKAQRRRGGRVIRTDMQGCLASFRVRIGYLV